jgi:hypothetical protein
MGIRTSKRRRVIGLLAAAGLALVVVAALVFEPWKLVIDQTVDETPPAGMAVPGAPAGADPQLGQPMVIARGTFISHEHDSSGSVVVLRLPDGSRVLRLQDLQTSNGPRLQVWLSGAPVLPGSDGWHVFDDGQYVNLGDLKGNIGSSNYPIPAEVDLADLTSVSIWCARFNVSFAAATLEPVTGSTG